MVQDTQLLETLFQLQPLGSLTAASARELAAMCYREYVGRNNDPFRLKNLQRQSVYLLRGELKLTYPDGSSEVLVGGSEAALFPIGKRPPAIKDAKAITDIELISFDDDLLDVMLTWDQLSGVSDDPRSAPGAEATDWYTQSSLFAVQNIMTRGLFAALPPSHIDELLKRSRRMKVNRNDVIVREGEPAEHYYVNESGRCLVTRKVGGGEIMIAELNSGDAFGEDSLVADTPRNATVTMLTDGVLLCLGASDFNALLREPMLRRVSLDDATQRVANGAVWLDVRFPAEYQFERMPGAINIPLNEIRNALGSLDPSKEYVVYCQSGRRSAAAAFLLSLRGFRALLLEGGMHGNTSGAEKAGVQ